MLLTYHINEKEKLLFWGEELNTRDDFFVQTNCAIEQVELLFFLDSRGISAGFETSLIRMILQELDNKFKYLVIGRPLEITIWLTLYNFLRLNAINPRKIITNMGFVDFTPKKKSIIQLNAFQFTQYFNGIDAKLTEVGKFKNQEGESMNLYVQEYPQRFMNELIRLFKRTEVVLIDTPFVSPETQFKRIRPTSFYDGLLATNAFHAGYKDFLTIIDLPVFGLKETYDGVHYTELGNQVIFQKLKPYLT
jgi:hypothetical protein